MPPAIPEPTRVYTLRVSLAESAPEIWRRIHVTDKMTLDDLHDTIQIAMGWTDSHLHRFTIGGKSYSKILPDIAAMDGQDDIDEDRVRLGRVLKKKGHRFEYVYDYGDYCVHDIVVEDIGEPDPGRFYPACLAGERACPPEDCGSMSGFYQMLESLADPTDEEHQSYLEWLGDQYDPEHFDLRSVNHVLRHFDQYVSGWDRDD